MESDGRKALKLACEEEEDLVENPSATAAASGGKSQAKGKRPCEDLVRNPSSASGTVGMIKAQVGAIFQHPGMIKAQVGAIFQHPGRKAQVEGKRPCEDPSATAAASAINAEWGAIFKKRCTQAQVSRMFSSGKANHDYLGQYDPNYAEGRLVPQLSRSDVVTKRTGLTSLVPQLGRSDVVMTKRRGLSSQCDFREHPTIKAVAARAIATGCTVKLTPTILMITDYPD